MSRRQCNRGHWVTGIIVFISFAILTTTQAMAQISNADEACAILNAATNAIGADNGMILAIERWSVTEPSWLYEIETSTGAQFLIDSAGSVIRTNREAVSRSRKQLERLTIARAVTEGTIPSLCELFELHYSRYPDSVVLDVKLEYDHGEFKAEVSYWDDAKSHSEREYEWEWER